MCKRPTELLNSQNKKLQRYKPENACASDKNVSAFQLRYLHEPEKKANTIDYFGQNQLHSVIYTLFVVKKLKIFHPKTVNNELM